MTNACSTINSDDLSHSELIKDCRVPNQNFIISPSFDSPSIVKHSSSVAELTAERYIAKRNASMPRGMPCIPTSQASEMLCCIDGVWMRWVRELTLARNICQ